MEKSIYDLEPKEKDPELEQLKLQLQRLNAQHFELQKQNEKNLDDDGQLSDTLIIQNLTDEIMSTKNEVEEMKGELETTLELTQELIDIIKVNNIDEPAVNIIPEKNTGEVTDTTFVLDSLNMSPDISLEKLVEEIQQHTKKVDDVKEQIVAASTPKIDEDAQIAQSVTLSPIQLDKIEDEISKTVSMIIEDIDEIKTEPLMRKKAKKSRMPMFLLLAAILALIVGLYIRG